MSDEENDSGVMFTPVQQYKRAAFYDFVARCLPTEGKDFSVTFVPKGSDGLGVSLQAHTKIGYLWCDYLRGRMIGGMNS